MSAHAWLFCCQAAQQLSCHHIKLYLFVRTLRIKLSPSLKERMSLDFSERWQMTYVRAKSASHQKVTTVLRSTRESFYFLNSPITTSHQNHIIHTSSSITTHQPFEHCLSVSLHATGTVHSIHILLLSLIPAYLTPFFIPSCPD